MYILLKGIEVAAGGYDGVRKIVRVVVDQKYC